MHIEPFTIAIPQEILDDLRERLERTRWPDEPAGAGWDYGSNLDYVCELVDYWRTRFDWRAQERALNRHHHYLAEVDGWRIHFIHERGAGPNPFPLILTHGWPSTFYELDKILPLLTDPGRHGGDPDDAFDVVVPSMPGYGFSDHRVRREAVPTHVLWAHLMEGLGYTRFGAQGGDFGARVTSNLGRHFPDRVAGIHVHSDYDGPNTLPPAEELSEAERDYLVRIARWRDDEGGYSHIQGTKPQTLAYGLTDSPVGLAAWIVEKLRGWSDCDGDVERRFSKDEQLTTVMLYWATQTIASSVRTYYEGRHYPDAFGPRTPIQVPAAAAMFPHDFPVPREWVARTYNLRQWSEFDRGGHFAAFEEPELLAEDIRAFFRTVR